jgi:hypothetical protein
MKNMFDAGTVEEVKGRITSLKPASERLWGKMTAAQALAHCSEGIRMAAGETKPPRVLIGRIIGPMIKGKVLGEGPMRRNSPTAKSLVVEDQRNLEIERQRLCGLIDRFSSMGASGCTTHPHPFFGPMKPEEWSILMYKHLDHHLRQFGV